MKLTHSDEELFRQKSRPAWCSERRWRIELRRRADARRYRDALPRPVLAAVPSGTHTVTELEASR